MRKMPVSTLKSKMIREQDRKRQLFTELDNVLFKKQEPKVGKLPGEEGILFITYLSDYFHISRDEWRVILVPRNWDKRAEYRNIYYDESLKRVTINAISADIRKILATNLRKEGFKVLYQPNYNSPLLEIKIREEQINDYGYKRRVREY